MRKFITMTLAATALATAVAPTVASAQDRRDDRHEIARDRAEVRQDMARGDRREARDDRRELRDDHRDMRNDRRDFRDDRRDDRHDDWRSYRNAHADRFRGPAYYGPRGYAYRPVTPGYRFAPAYYSQRYWINDPAYYRLPVLPRNERWVRYGRDVVRIDIRSGRTIQVFGSFFL